MSRPGARTLAVVLASVTGLGAALVSADGRNPDAVPDAARPVIAAAPAGPPAAAAAAAPRARPTFKVTFDRAVVKAPVDGRLMVIVSRAATGEPRDQVADVADGVPFWGVDVNGVRPSSSVLVGDGPGTYGYPLPTIAALPVGDYTVQAFLNVYTTFRRSDGSVVKLHQPCGDGHDVFASTGNLYGRPVRVRVTPGGATPVDLHLSSVIAPSDPVPAGGTCQQGNPTDTEHVKHVKIRSAALSRFWGRDSYVAADVLLPDGYDDPANRTVRYPMEVNEGHYPGDSPKRFREDGSNAFSAYWLSGHAPKFLVVTFRHENPYYDDSYAVDSANLGPYGTALNRELLPVLDTRFRTIGSRAGRVLSGGSTGGWIAAATQLFYPDLYQGSWVGYPDPLDFHAHQLVDVYDDANAYVTQHEWTRVPVPSARETSGKTDYTMAQENLYELALGTHGRSGLGQWDIWQAVFSPQGRDGYPRPIWDKLTGAIDHTTAAYWGEHWDLAAYTERNWARLRPLVGGQLDVYVGDNDTYFLDNGVDLFKKRVDQLPGSAVTYQFGQNQPHGYTPFTTEQFYDALADHVAANASEAPPPVRAAVRAWQAAG